LLHYADLLPDANVQMLVMLGVAYIALRWLEAAGLWFDKVWGEYLGALSGGIYIPFELVHLVHEVSLINAAVLVLNVITVAYLVYILWQRRQHIPAP
jgi:uncharacterized membrane protein (DUF2068 family)